ncbi:MAG: hypothetical protein HYT93_00085 [Parcubacteria group bacterium]|nr:hypothetical protein [Parcubacteria group bacterium]
MEKEKKFFSKELAQFILPEIVIDEKHYTISEGSIVFVEAPPTLKREVVALRAGYYSLLTRVEPFLAIPETDIETLRNSIARMEQSFDNFAGYYYPREEKILRSNLYPTDFLYSIADLEKARRDVVERPSVENIKTYDALLERTVKIYRKNAEKMKHIYAEHDQKNFFLPTGTISNETYVTFLNTLINASYDIDEKRNNRMKCFNGNIKKCSLASASFQPFLNSQEVSEQENFYSIPEIIKSNASLIRNYYSILSVSNETEKQWYESMPVIVLGSSACALEDTPAYYTVMPQKYGSEFSPRIVLLNDLYFHISKNTEKPLQRALQEKTNAAFPLLYQPIPTSYSCPDYGTDFVKIMAILKIRSLLSEHDWFLGNKTITELQEKITAFPIVYQDDVVIFLNTLSFLYGAKDLKTNFNTNELLFIERLLTLYRTKTAYVDQLIFAVTGYSKFLSTLALLGVKVDFHDLFLFYAAPSSAFLSFNKSIVTDTPFLITHKEKNLEKNGLISLKNDLQDTYSRQAIIDIIKKSDLIIYTRQIPK